MCSSSSLPSSFGGVEHARMHARAVVPHRRDAHELDVRRLALVAPGLDRRIEREAVAAAVPEHFDHFDLAGRDAGRLGRHDLLVVRAFLEARGRRRRVGAVPPSFSDGCTPTRRCSAGACASSVSLTVSAGASARLPRSARGCRGVAGCGGSPLAVCRVRLRRGRLRAERAGCVCLPHAREQHQDEQQGSRVCSCVSSCASSAGSAQALDVRGDRVDLFVGHRARRRRASSDSDRSGVFRRDTRAAARRRTSRADRGAAGRPRADCRRPSGRDTRRTRRRRSSDRRRDRGAGPATPCRVGFQARRLLRREVGAEIGHVVVRQRIAIGVISGFLRAPLLKACSCLRMYCSCWPARFGHSGFALLPFDAMAGDARRGLRLPFFRRAAASARRSRHARLQTAQHEEQGNRLKASSFATPAAAAGAKGAELYTSEPPRLPPRRHP